MAKQKLGDKVDKKAGRPKESDDGLDDVLETSTGKQTDREMVTDILIPDSEVLEFICPNCGKISQNDVVFLCNTCDNSELIFKDGIYICPQCLYPGDNFECMKCENKKVKMRRVKKL